MSNRKNKQSDISAKKCSLLFWRIVFFAVLVCLAGMLYCCISFAVTSVKFSAECRESLLTIQSLSDSNKLSETPSENSASTSSDIKAVNESLITHMENIVAIQRSGMTNDLMSFIYGILSTILVGICAASVAKSRTSADEAEKTAAEAKKNADEAKRQAAIAEKKAGEANKAIKNAQNAILMAKELRYQVQLIIISYRILAAKNALSDLNSVAANRIIIQIRDEISWLFSKDRYKLILKYNNYDGRELNIVYDELLDLKQKVDEFSKMCQEHYSDVALDSMEGAVQNYHKWIQLALDRIDACVLSR